MSVGPKIIAGAWKGKKLSAPPGFETRPTGARARQAAFDILLHAPWAGAEFLRNARVLDGFAGTGAYGLEALSRGAAAASFLEVSAPALAAIRTNIAACGVADRCSVVAGDLRAARPGPPHGLVFLDPPYGLDLVGKALKSLGGQGWIAPGAIIVAELGPLDEISGPEFLSERRHGKARLVFFRQA